MQFLLVCKDDGGLIVQTVVFSVNRKTLAHTNFSCDMSFNSSAVVGSSKFFSCPNGLCRLERRETVIEDGLGAKFVTSILDFGTSNPKRIRFFSFFGKVRGAIILEIRDVHSGELFYSKEMVFSHDSPSLVEISVPRTFFRRSMSIGIILRGCGFFSIDKMISSLIIRPHRLSAQR